MGLRPSHYSMEIRHAVATICVIRHEDGSLVRGVGILYPNTRHMFFAEVQSLSAEDFWRAVYAVSKIFWVGDKAVKLAVRISGKEPLEGLEDEAGGYLSCDHTLESLRTETHAQIIPQGDLKNIIKGFNDFGAPIYKGAPREDRRFPVGIRLQPGSRWKEMPTMNN